ncbi:uncharacterized protein BO97DRAFT_432929 [Aspergillus homomorphus CBS 101889]|uniref:Aminoglycoside phosphotransferase domain-containing protein n=1 Tax=Aspergillus homomorphus (strain CBS 101889) TaxID=1450537 RepID=A0A395I2F2_ASPHC|nr:hypothetical protein BO97DRAFT_432929 [Aspergillus homomorphus CBS 101889]RAL14240.1 hypothetical protein BO97DRAFT_432929 [Aspergillus homomorphus CBS 101889]
MDPHFSEDLLEGYSDTELIKHRQKMLWRLWRLPKDLDYAVGPTVRRTVYRLFNTYIIVDRTEGNTLDVIWTAVHDSQAWSTASLMHKNPAIRHLPNAGSLATGECRPFWLEDKYGLPTRSGPRELNQFIQCWPQFTSMPPVMQVVDQDPMPDATEPIPIGTKFLWLLDWEFAGFCPISFEYASMYDFIMPQDCNCLACLRCTLFTSVTRGCYKAEARILDSIESKFIHLLWGRGSSCRRIEGRLGIP